MQTSTVGALGVTCRAGELPTMIGAWERNTGQVDSFQRFGQMDEQADVAPSFTPNLWVIFERELFHNTPSHIFNDRRVWLPSPSPSVSHLFNRLGRKKTRKYGSHRVVSKRAILQNELAHWYYCEPITECCNILSVIGKLLRSRAATVPGDSASVEEGDEISSTILLRTGVSRS